MQIWMTLILAVQLLSALAMIGLVLLQHGKGADMGASFGSGASGSLFGASGSANFLSRSTAVLASVFFVCTLALAYFGTHVAGRDAAAAPAAAGSVLDRPATPNGDAGAGAGAGAIPAVGTMASAPAAGATTQPAAAPGAIPTAPAQASSPAR